MAAHCTAMEMASCDLYLDRYAHFSFQEQELKDYARTEAYKNAILENKHLFKGKTVLDVGCGIGMLSIFAARAGASRVIGVDCSKVIDLAREIINDNHLDHVITLIRGKLETIELPDGIKQVDIIICDWMGQCLFNGAILSTVIYARNKWLKPKVGMMFPDRISLFVTAIEAHKLKDNKIYWWDDVYGFDMTAIGRDAIIEPLVITVNPKKIVTNSYLIKEIDMYTVVWQDSNIVSPFHLKAERDDFVNALVTYFNVEFTKCRKFFTTTINTSPDSMPTHWRQTVFFLDKYLTIKQGEEIHGTFAMKTNGRKKNREVEIDIDVRFEGELSQVTECDHYRMQP